jgi:hypothetical protein
MDPLIALLKKCESMETLMSFASDREMFSSHSDQDTKCLIKAANELMNRKLSDNDIFIKLHKTLLEERNETLGKLGISMGPVLQLQETIIK